ncbi:GNAT family N-acetyltransferase [Chondromyces crocatus]|nr:GNAT family N-acetyltransferase [Chondromyces crocatus]
MRSPPLTARPATPADHPHFARLFPELGTGDPIPSPERWTETMAAGTFLFEDTSADVVAYAYIQVLSGTAYVRHLVVDPAHRGRGLGRVAMGHLATRLLAAGCSQWCLNVKPDNRPAVRLYESLGFSQVYLSAAFRFGWDLLLRLPRPSERCLVRPVSPADDSVIEAAFALPSGQLDDLRRKPDTALLSLHAITPPDAPPRAFAAYDPHFPGAFPFRVATPALALPLLEAIRPHEHPESPYMQLVSEQQDLTDMLLEAGATERLRIMHMRGALPPPDG